MNMERLPVERRVLSDNLEVISPHERVQYHEFNRTQKFTHDSIVEIVRNGINLHNYIINWLIPGSGTHDDRGRRRHAFTRQTALFFFVIAAWQFPKQ